MKMNSLAVVTPPPAIYYGFYAHKKLWEDNFTPVNMNFFGRRNVRKHRDIKNGEKYIILDIYSKLDCYTQDGIHLFITRRLYGKTR